MPPLWRAGVNSRPLRPPRTELTSNIRHFARNPQRLRLSPVTPRPQLSFLTTPTNAHLRLRRGQWQLSRLITTEQKRWVKQQAWDTWRITVYFTIVSAFGLTFAWWVVHELLEREFPTPHEWSLLSRMKYHSAKGMESPDVANTGTTQWGMVALACKKLVKRLEDEEGDGEGLLELGSMQNKTGPESQLVWFDLTNKPEPWRRGYFDILMSLAKTAEQLENMVLDTSRGFIFPRQYVIGPSNPHHKTLPPWRKGPAPLEANCTEACERPEVFYEKILATKGFTVRQQMDAAFAYSEWLNFQGKHDEAEKKIRWGLDLALEGLPSPSATIDRRTAVLRSSAPLVTDNVVTACRALAIHLAQTSRTDAALPIFLSVLRAYRSAPVEAPKQSPSTRSSRRENEPAATDIQAFIDMVNNSIEFLKPVEYPAPPPPGNEPLVRLQPDDCKEPEVMAYIGEIIFATSKSQRDTGLQWTRQALELADGRAKQRKLGLEERKRCVRCMDVALENWQAMIENIQAEEEKTAGANDTPKWKEEDKEFFRWTQKINREDLKGRMEADHIKLWANWLTQVF
jgi:hypothetical protein